MLETTGRRDLASLYANGVFALHELAELLKVEDELLPFWDRAVAVGLGEGCVALGEGWTVVPPPQPTISDDTATTSKASTVRM